MSKKTSIIAITLLIVAAVILGFIFVNKGDGPVMGMIISDKTIINVQNFQTAKSSQDSDLYMVLDKEINKFNEKAKTGIPAGKDIYANIYLVECPKGSQFTVKWIIEGKTIKEETKELSTNQRGVISYLLEGNKLKSGNYILELYSEDRKLFKYGFSVE